MTSKALSLHQVGHTDPIQWQYFSLHITITVCHTHHTNSTVILTHSTHTGVCQNNRVNRTLSDMCSLLQGRLSYGGWESNLPGFVKWGLRDGHFNFIFNPTHDTVTVNCYCYFIRSTIGNELLLAVTSLQYVLYGQNNYIRLLSDA